MANVDDHASSAPTGATYGVKPQTGLEMPTSQHQPVANQQTPQRSVADLQSLFESSSQLPTTERSTSPPSDQKLPLGNGKPSTRLQHLSSNHHKPPDYLEHDAGHHQMPSASLQFPSFSHFLEPDPLQLSPGNPQSSATHESVPDSHQPPKLPSSSQEKPSDVVHEPTNHRASLDGHEQLDSHSHPPASLETPTAQHQPLNSKQQSETTLQPKSKHKKPSITFKLPELSSSHDPTKQKSPLTGQEVAGEAPSQQQLPSGNHQPSSACQQPTPNGRESSVNHRPPSTGHRSATNGSQPPSTGQQNPQQLAPENLKSSSNHQPAPGGRRNGESRKSSSGSLQSWVSRQLQLNPLRSTPGNLRIPSESSQSSQDSQQTTMANQSLQHASSQRFAETEIPPSSLQQPPCNQQPQQQTSPQTETSPQQQTSLHDLLHAEVHTKSKKDHKKSSAPQKRLEKLLSQSCNKHCADCGSTDPKWVCLPDL
ncbi:hypothetical protein LINGRAHAP2_LOCUS8701 [Linum grandiflorum]